MASRDPATIATLLTPDFASIDVNGKETSADEMIASVVALDIDRSKRNARTVLVDIIEDDDEALVQQYTMTSTSDAPPSMPRSVLTLSHDIWRKVNDTWFLARTDTLEIEVVTASGRRRHLRKDVRYVVELVGPA
jgi:hypothetical protein